MKGYGRAAYGFMGIIFCLLIDIKAVLLIESAMTGFWANFVLFLTVLVTANMMIFLSVFGFDLKIHRLRSALSKPNPELTNKTSAPRLRVESASESLDMNESLADEALDTLKRRL